MKPTESQGLERVLESAIVVSWADLTRGRQGELIHVEYGFTPGGTLDYLQVWTSITRGHWLLSCEYWMSASRVHRPGVHFENGYQSEGLANILESVMQHQTCFALPADLGRQGLLQVLAPTQEERAVAAASVKEALDGIGPETKASMFGEQYRVVAVDSDRLLIRGIVSGEVLTIVNETEAPLTQEDYPPGKLIALTDPSTLPLN
jgi:hypothetical protein